MKKSTSLILFLFALCPLLYAGEKAPYLDPAPSPASVEEYQKKHPRLSQSEMEKIYYLLERMTESSCEFERNGELYRGQDASRFLRMKMMTPPWRGSYKTAEEFIAKVASRSSTTGKPYHVTCGGESRLLTDVLTREREFISSPPAASS
ncbi:MAG TPA: DUF5329 family protein [Verrucomicrobiae bacterium]|jgi:hypothetical protein|nr:DUF5329 family protein [Verrucomicrobiae bacterium]